MAIKIKCGDGWATVPGTAGTFATPTQYHERVVLTEAATVIPIGLALRPGDLLTVLQENLPLVEGQNYTRGDGSITLAVAAKAGATMDFFAMHYDIAPTRGHVDDRDNPHCTPQVLTGSILIWPGATIPEGYFLCDGRAVSRTQYAALFAAIGTTYGAGDGASTFALPDFRSRVAVGKGSDTEFSTLGKAGGEKAHTLTVAEMPKHEHPMPRNYAFVDSSISGYNFASQADGVWNAAPANWAVAVGGNGAHNNLPPYLTLNYIIKA